MYPLTLPFPTFVNIFTLTENLIAFWSISDIKLSPVQFKTSVLHLVQRFSPACYMTCNSRKDSVCCLFTLQIELLRFQNLCFIFPDKVVGSVWLSPVCCCACPSEDTQHSVLCVFGTQVQLSDSVTSALLQCFKFFQRLRSHVL